MHAYHTCVRPRKYTNGSMMISARSKTMPNVAPGGASLAIFVAYLSICKQFYVNLPTASARLRYMSLQTRN